MTPAEGLRTVAALYIDPRGPYPKIPGVDCWDEERDARNYEGDDPIVAHPPCQLWGPFALVNYRRWGGEHNLPGNDGGCFAHAIHAVRTLGGVLEHPAQSKAWDAFKLMKPSTKIIGWQSAWDGWVCEVWQSAYGHKARKRTWLFYCGDTPPEDANWAREPGTHQCGFHDQRGKERNKPTVGKREASATPPAFAEYLVRLARSSRVR